MGKVAKKKLSRDWRDIRLAMGSYLLHRLAADDGTPGIDGGAAPFPNPEPHSNALRVIRTSSLDSRVPRLFRLKSGPQVRLVFNLPQGLTRFSR